MSRPSREQERQAHGSQADGSGGRHPPPGTARAPRDPSPRGGFRRGHDLRIRYATGNRDACTGLQVPPGHRIARRFQLGRLQQDRPFQLAQLPARFDAELAGQHVTGPAESGQGVGLPSRPVQGQHQLGVKALPVRRSGGQRLELRHELTMMP